MNHSCRKPTTSPPTTRSKHRWLTASIVVTHVKKGGQPAARSAAPGLMVVVLERDHLVELDFGVHVQIEHERPGVHSD